MTRIHILSDLHTEFGAFEPPDDLEADVTILAGDTTTRAELHPWRNATRAFGRTVIAVAGNHDYYGSSIDGGLNDLRTAARSRRTIFLENRAVTMGNTRVLGCTLWTDYRLFATSERDVAWHMYRCEEAVIDHKRILHVGERDRFKPRHAAALHAKSVAWLDEELGKPWWGTTVVVTHHAPSPQCLDPRFPQDALSSAFASNRDPLIEKHKPHLWISGHTHHCVDFRIGDTRMLANQRGYVGDVSPGFDPSLVVEV